ncbi:MAG: glycoside hydrolase family 3 [Candidatus Marinimicrobia bacterium]|nr:glycoside hydrolase family 3 [Candidatus Neomarinimicrobiota bacterium]|tara:strand:- start:4024 stop:5058 length:1035 start_codon:yes stop_codon:yes gene_type:complete
MIKEIGNLIIAGFRGSSISEGTLIQKWIHDYQLGGVILYDMDLEYKQLGTRNIQSAEQLKSLNNSLQSISKEPLFIAIDQEGGEVNRLNIKYGFPDFPSWKEIGKNNDINFTENYSKKLGELLNDLNINLNFAPVLDIDGGKSSFIAKQGRALSSDILKITHHSRVFIEQLQNKGVICCGKHFPGQGSASADTHAGATDITNTWSEKELEPYNDLIKSKHLDAIIIAHTFHNNFDNEFPASMSRKTITDLLRVKMGFSGIVICDDPSMKAISAHYDLKTTLKHMLNAGVDMFILGNNLEYDPNLIPNAVHCLRELVSEGEISKNKIYESLNRIKSLRSKIKLND